MRQFVVTLLLLLAATPGCSSEPAEALPNVRLGMAPRDVRERFHPGGDGTWQTGLGAGDDTVIEWSARDTGSPVARARFEFHLGMLVAIRARTHERLEQETISSTAKTVTHKAPAQEGGASVVVLARDCPTHKEEAESLAAKAAH